MVLRTQFIISFRFVTAREVPIRDDITGELITPGEMDAKIENIVKQACASGRYSSIVVHMVIGTKTGHCVPSVTCFQRLAAEYPQVIPVVDACQMRGLKALCRYQKATQKQAFSIYIYIYIYYHTYIYIYYKIHIHIYIYIHVYICI